MRRPYVAPRCHQREVSQQRGLARAWVAKDHQIAMLAEGLFNRHAARDFDWTLAFAFILRSAFVALFHFFRCTQRDKNVLQFRTLLLASVNNACKFQQFCLCHQRIEVRLALVLLHFRI